MGDVSLGVGDTVDGKYQVLELLGTGGMSNVWLARDRRLEKPWAIKEIRPQDDGARGRRACQALLDEASFMKRLDHPAIPRIVDIVDTGAATFVIMDYVEGRSLGARMQMGHGPFSQDEVLDWGVQLCDVLSYLHGLNPPVVYRDLKPANIMVREDGSVRLIDFGIAIEQDRVATETEAIGTPGYAAPEQLPLVEGQADAPSPCMVDARADIYSLGVTLYALASGHTPRVVADTTGALQVDFSMQPLRMWNPRLSEGLERIVERATRVEPDERYQTAQEMRYDLEHYEELTEEWREACRSKLFAFRRRLVGAGICLVVGVSCLWTSHAVREASYADLVHEAQTASRAAAAGEESAAERLYVKALALEPDSVDAYRSLLEVYTADGCLDEGESERWQALCGPARGLVGDPHYARLCFDVATSYLAYFGVAANGGSVGNAALESMGMAAPWLERMVDACVTAPDAQADVDEEDLRVAQGYLVIARFHADIARIGREGTAGGTTYRGFWNTLEGMLKAEAEQEKARSFPEGVQLRLCQAGAEALASPTYLAGFARAGIGREEAEGLLQLVRDRMDALEGFAASPEYAAVYGPVFAEVRGEIELAGDNVETTYGNPVAVWEGA